ncbi:MAG: hypothetical protein MUP44_08755, partial [Anaerolineales bacterium]|nr:hypothetical protein [Anaerolineales bacterium]
IATGTWYFCVQRFVPSTSLDVWVQDVKVSNLVGVPAAIFDSTSPFEIGRLNNDNTRTHDGRASLCFLCAAALSDSIIGALFQSTRKAYNV